MPTFGSLFAGIGGIDLNESIPPYEPLLLEPPAERARREAAVLATRITDATRPVALPCDAQRTTIELIRNRVPDVEGGLHGGAMVTRYATLPPHKSTRQQPTPWPRSITVVGPPVAKARPRFVKATGHVYTPNKTQQQEWEIRQAWIAAHGDVPAIGPLSLHIDVFLPRPKSIPKSRRATAQPVVRPDIDNYAKTVLDALNGVAFADDAQVCLLWVRKSYVECAPSWRVTLNA